MTLEGLPEDKKASACIGCGKCSKICPQNIDIPAALSGMMRAALLHQNVNKFNLKLN
ncbi:MAG: 4Fe-4S dicluster domain-containing protein [Firmicutes bacterium]|nr:4Fe-4S dicluster domain-containing protein [Bacillota bacterium]